jgi:hypothetical protein
MLVIARSPSVSKLNGSDSERSVTVWMFHKMPLSYWGYQRQVSKYGAWKPLVEEALQPQSKAKLEDHYKDQVGQTPVARL